MATKKSGPKGERKKKALSSESELADAALSYLDRYDASEAGLKRLLLRKIRAHGDETTLDTEDVDRLIERLRASRVVDDLRYATNLTASLRNRGASSLKIASKLKARGVSQTDSEQAKSEDSVSELEAARTYARKRRLRTRFDLSDPKERQKALAALARQGFSFDVASRALAPEEE